MATLSVTIPTAITQRVLDGVAYQNGYTDTIPDLANPGQNIPNPVTKAQFCKDLVKVWIKNNVTAYETAKAAGAAGAAARASADADIVITD